MKSINIFEFDRPAPADEQVECPRCHGDGYITIPHYDDTEGISICPKCHGSGYILADAPKK